MPCSGCKIPRQVLRTPSEVQRDENIDDLRKKLREAKQQVTELNGKLDALAAVTANLYHENQQLRRKLGNRRSPVTLSES